MARTVLVGTAAPGSYPNPPAGVAFPLTAADVGNMNACKATGRELIVAFNSDGANPYTVTITSKADTQGRLGDITTESLAFGTYHIFGPFPLAGWQQADGNLYFQGSNAAIKFGIIILP